jgi:RNA polymerase sigma factor (sigma-70 family)
MKEVPLTPVTSRARHAKQDMLHSPDHGYQTNGRSAAQHKRRDAGSPQSSTSSTLHYPGALGPDVSVAERTIWDAINRGIEQIARTNRDPRRPGKQDADWHDCRQDALLKVQELDAEVQRLAIAENWPALAGLAYTIAHNLAVDWVRKKRPVQYLEREDDQRAASGVSEAQSPLARAVEVNFFQEVRTLLPRLSPKEREIFGIYLSLREQETLGAAEALAHATLPIECQQRDLALENGGSVGQRLARLSAADDLSHEGGLWSGLIEACDLNPATVPSYREANIYEQIGAILNIDPQTARTRMSRARANLRTLYRETYGDLYNAQIT